MAIDKGKFQEEEEAAAVARFHKIILGWDYTQLLKETEVKRNSFIYTTPFFFFLYISILIPFVNTDEEQEGY